jgi:hypothetical protein
MVESPQQCISLCITEVLRFGIYNYSFAQFSLKWSHPTQPRDIKRCATKLPKCLNRKRYCFMWHLKELLNSTKSVGHAASYVKRLALKIQRGTCTTRTLYSSIFSQLQRFYEVSSDLLKSAKSGFFCLNGFLNQFGCSNQLS